MFLSVATFLWQYKKLFAIAAVILAVVGSVLYYGHTRYNAGEAKGLKVAAEAKLALAKEREAHKANIQQWEAQVAAVTAENQRITLRATQVIDRAAEEFKADLKAARADKDTRNAQIKDVIKPTDVVVVPSHFGLLYNGAVEGSRIATRTEQAKTNQEGPKGIVGASATFDATAFTEVMLANADRYTSLAIQCNKLIDIVEGIEHASDPSGVD
jgi:hypothetical protein